MQSICLITCYMGPLPNYFGMYVASCKKNNSFNFIVINDTIAQSSVDGNIQYIKWSLQDLNNFSSKRLNENINLKSAWKINEIKPLFGLIFKEDLAKFDFWGWCDLDIIWGDLRKFLNDELLSRYDVITSKVNWTAGHFTLFRNNAICNNLYARFNGVIELLNSPTYYAFEECCHRWNGVIYTFEELQNKKLPISMFDIVKRAENTGEIRAHFKDIIREHPQAINYTYKNGTLMDLDKMEEFMYYHLITVKKIWRFYIPSYSDQLVDLRITPFGIRSENEAPFVWKIKRAISCSKGIWKSVKKQSLKEIVGKLLRARH